ncbi:apolipoprotein B-100-like [Pseudorasbora parva]|uniref:apolipoprotein B-100-like n=1 Tax=Pseudorasbora parva TaxID=51549 RepID=UPI00351E06DE
MGNMRLCLLLLFGTYAIALSKRFKIYKKYTYWYEAEIQNRVTGTSPLINGPKLSCKVEIDVPLACSFVLRTSECSLTEVVGTDANEAPIYSPAAEAQAFQSAMEKNVLKFVVESETGVKLYPEDDENNILNFKRGIISALIVPVMEKEQNKDMITVHGICATDVKVNTKEDITTDITITRDLSGCDNFKTQRSHTSPLAIITGLQYPLSKLIGSTQTCNYKFDNQKKHMTSATCTEKHIFLPFSYQNKYGISSLVKQILTLQETSKINDRVFDYSSTNPKDLVLEAVDDKVPVQTSEALLFIFRKLISMNDKPDRQLRANIFQSLVTELRGLKHEVLQQTITQMMEEDKLLTWQAFTQCGTPECGSAMFSILKTFDTDAIEVDAVVYALGIMHSPTGLLVKDILEIAQTKQSKPIMYALSNAVRRHFQAERQVTSEILEVYNFITSILGADCAGEKDLTLLTLRVIGNMGEAMEAADPNMKTILLKCMRQPATTLSVQMSAIQAFRRMSVTSDVRSNIQRVALYAKGAVQKRLAAYLILMKKPEASDLEVVKKILTQDQNVQVKSFVASHVYNIIHSRDPEIQELGKRIVKVMQDDEVLTHANYTQLSRNYKVDMFMPGKDVMGSSTQGSVIFDPSSQLPREVMLETTLKAFSYNLDFIEFGMDGKGFEPTVETLFGSNGFFPDTISKAMYWVGDKMPNKINEVLQEWVDPLRTEKTKRQVPENIIREMVRNFNKLSKDLYNQDSPETMAYLRIMGNELGYIKSTNELTAIVDRMATYIQALKYSPAWITKVLMSGDRSIFAHYIFMDNEFSLPTASGFPLKFALSGTFAPGVEGGLRIEPGKRELSFSPSMAVEFVTRMGVFIPKFVSSAVEMHTNMFHESSLNAKITKGDGQIKLSIPAPKGTTELFRVSNKLVMVSKTKVTLVPDTGDRTAIVHCSPFISGINYCTTILNSRAERNSPYFPLSGQSNFVLGIQPTGDITEYAATIAYELLNEGKEGRQKVDSLKMTLKAEGNKPTEASATIKYNRNKNILTTGIAIPDYDIEAGIKVGVTDSIAKGKMITIDIVNKNIHQFSLIGRAKLDTMKDGLLEAQLIVPSLSTEGTLTATLNCVEDLTLELKNKIKLPETNSVQTIIFQYAKDEMRMKIKSDIESEIQKLIPNTALLQSRLDQVFDDIMEHKVVKTDMKLRHIYVKLWEAYHIWMDKIASDVPYLKTLRQNIPELVIPSMPERVFVNSESIFKYKFNKDRVTFTIPLPLGGKTSEDLKIPPFMATPDLTMPQIGLMLPSKQFSLPTFSIPSSYDLSMPLLGMVEVSAKVSTNFYDIEAVFSGGNNTANKSSYTAGYKVVANSPLELLAFTLEGSAQTTGISGDTVKFNIISSLKHKLLDANFSLMETKNPMESKITDAVKTTGNYKIEAFSPLGMQMSMTYTTQVLVSSEISGDGSLDGSLKVGSMSASTTATQTFILQPRTREGKAESTFMVRCPIFQIKNQMKAAAVDGELSFESNTAIENDPVHHTTMFNIELKDVKVTIKSDSVTKVNEQKLQNQVDFTATMKEVTLRIESQADDNTNRVFSQLDGSLNTQGLELNTDATISFSANRASNKGTLSFNKDGLTSSFTTNVQVSSLNFESIVHGGITTTGAVLSVSTKGTVHENSAELKVEGRLASSEVYLNSMYEGDIFNVNTRNRINFKLNEDGLNLSNNLIASHQEMKIENTDCLILTLKSLAIRSESDSYLNENNFYKHNIVVDMHDFTVSLNVNNELKVTGVNLINDAQMMAKLYRMEVTGTLKVAFGEEELRHKYEITYVDKTATSKCSTNGKILGTQIIQSSEFEIVEFSTKFSNEVRFISPSLRLESNILIKAKPFSVNVESSFNSDGVLNLYGKHSGQVKSILLIQAELTSYSHKYECKASTSHQMNNGNSIETNFQHKITSAITPQQQSFNMNMKSTLNDHAFDHSLELFNTLKNTGIELKCTVSTNLLNKANDNQEFAITSALQYEKNSDSHFISLPFIEKLSVLIREVKSSMLTMKDHSIEMLHGIDDKYDINSKGAELSQVIENFDADMFLDDVRFFTSYIVTEMGKNLQSVRNLIDSLDRTTGIITKINEIFSKIDEVFAEFEIEAMVEKIINDAVDLMKQYELREIMQSAASYLNSLDLKPVVERIFGQINKLKKQLNTKVNEIISYDFDTLADEVKQIATDLIRIPCFGMLHGEIEIKSSEHTLKTNAELKNSTDKITANLNSQFQTPIDLLAYTFDATAHLNIPRMKELSLSETVKASHMAFSLDHQGIMSINDVFAQLSSKTTAKATTEPYTADLVNNAFLSTENGFSCTFDTSYIHTVNMPVANIFSEATMTQKAAAQLEYGVFTLTLGNDGKGKYSILDYSDEGTHQSNLEIVINVESIKLIFDGDTESSLLKMKQNVNAEIGGLSQIKFNVHVETETPFIKRSISAMKGQICLKELMFELSGSHDAELIGKVEGTTTNLINFKAVPFEIIFNTKNKKSTKLMLPFTLFSKIDLQNDINLTLSPSVHQASWTSLARFNQFKYSHYISMANGEKEIQISASVNGEADFNVLTLPINIPKLTIPFIDKETPYVEKFSLWEDTGLKTILITPQQTFDMDAKLKYVKNHEMFNMLPVLNSVIRKIEIPIFANNKISPDIYRCHYLAKIPLPSIKDSIMIPVIGDLTYDLSVKTAMIAINTKAEILNQDEIDSQFETKATSEFGVFNGKTSGSATFSMKSGMKLLSNFIVEHQYFENNYNGFLEANTEVLKAVMSNTAKVNLPDVKFMLYHKLTGDAEEGLTVSISSPSAGLLGLQLQSKNLSHHTGRLFSANPSEDNVDILKVDIMIKNSNRLSFQTQWNNEFSSQIILWLKEKVASLKDLKDTITYYITGISSKISQNTLMILRAYQKNIQALLEAATSFMRDTQFQLPGHVEKLSGLEVYNKISVFIFDVIENAITRVPDLFTSYAKAVIEHIKKVEVTIPGSTHIITGRDVLDDIHVAFQEIQSQMITIVKGLRDISIETIVQKLSEILKLSVEKAEELLNANKFQDLDKLSSWMSEVFTDAVNSKILSEITEQVEKYMAINEDYYKTVKVKAQDIFAEMTSEQLNEDIQAWIESMMNWLEVLMNQITKTLKDASKSIQFYVRVSDTELDIDIPIPFIWDFFIRMISHPCIKTLIS